MKLSLWKYVKCNYHVVFFYNAVFTTIASAIDNVYSPWLVAFSWAAAYLSLVLNKNRILYKNKWGDFKVLPGDVADRAAIDLVKMLKLQTKEALYNYRIVSQPFYNEYKSMLGRNSSNALDRLFEQLVGINSMQWDAEDRVRTEESWAAAFDARKLNSERVAVKNQINELFGAAIEQKKYQWKDK